MRKVICIFSMILLSMLLSSYVQNKVASYPLTVHVNDLRNSNGVVQFTVYNIEGSLPDEHFVKYYRQLTNKIVNGSAKVTFSDLPQGIYAVNILHDEDNDGKIKMGVILPKEGVGFSNYQSISIFNRPNFRKASFDLAGDKEIWVSIIYL